MKKTLTDKVVLKKGGELQEVLRRVLLDGYAGSNVNDNGDGTKFADYRSGNWYVIDYWEGGEPFGGIIRAYYDEVICWSMSYQGRIENTNRRAEVEAFLKEALSQQSNKFTIRGPYCYGCGSEENSLRYICDSCDEGVFDIGGFRVRDKIVDLNGNIFYSGEFIGGWKNLY